MTVGHEAPAVAIARAHFEALTNHDFDAVRDGLAPDFRGTVAGTQPSPRTVELNSVDEYLTGVTTGPMTQPRLADLGVVAPGIADITGHKVDHNSKISDR